MKTPYIAFGINDQHQLTITHVAKPGEKDPFSFEIALQELDTDGLDKAIDRIGRWALGSLAHWYPQEWSRLPNLTPPFNPQADLDLISDLMSKSSALKTKAFIPAIDLLVSELAKTDATTMKHPTVAVWPDIRARLERLPDQP
jgi:hypothetical protein